jgi:hypothetical protein
MGAKTTATLQRLEPKKPLKNDSIGQCGWRAKNRSHLRLAQVATKVNPERCGQSDEFLSTEDHPVNLFTQTSFPADERRQAQVIAVNLVAAEKFFSPAR